jgi:hypothetical protein
MQEGGERRTEELYDPYSDLPTPRGFLAYQSKRPPINLALPTLRMENV